MTSLLFPSPLYLRPWNGGRKIIALLLPQIINVSGVPFRWNVLQPSVRQKALIGAFRREAKIPRTSEVCKAEGYILAPLHFMSMPTWFLLGPLPLYFNVEQLAEKAGPNQLKCEGFPDLKET